MSVRGLRPSLFGRAAETQLLSVALDRVASGRLAVVLFEGEAGIGKTRLLESALQTAGTRGMSAVAGCARELERNRPFGVLVEAFGVTSASPDPRRVRIASLLATSIYGERGAVTLTSDPGLQFRLVDAFGDLIEELALSRPLVIGVDDLQWADPSTLLTLATVSRRVGDLPVAVIGCFRPAPKVALLDRLVGALVADGAQQVGVGALDDGAVRDLAIQVLAAEPRSTLLAQLGATAGNPLFIHELLEVLLREGAISIEDGLADAASTTLPPSLRTTIVRRLSFLPDESIRVLTAASLLGSSFSITDLATTTGRSAGDLTPSLTEAVTAQVLGADGDRLYFRHDLIRDALYEDLAAPIRHALHLEAGRRLAANRAPALQVAEHLSRGADPGDTEAVDWLVRAAREALAGSPQVAADLLERAVALTAPTDPGRDPLVVEQAQVALLTGRTAQAEGLCRALLERPHDSRVETAALICLGRALQSGGQPVEGLRELERAAQAGSVSASERAASLAWSSSALVWLGEIDRAAVVADEARRVAGSVEDQVSVSIAMTMLSVVARLRGHLGESLRLSDDLLVLTRRGANAKWHWYPVYAPRAYTLIELDRIEEAAAAIDTGLRISEDLGTAWHQPSFQMVRAVGHFTTGEWDGAQAEIEAMSELATDTGDAYGNVIGLSLLSVINVHRNNLVPAEQTARTAMTFAERSGERHSAHLAGWAWSLVLEAAGRPDEAYATLCTVWQRCTDQGLVMVFRIFGADLVRLCLATGHAAGARQTAAAVTELADQNQVLSLQAAALRCQGLAEGDAGLLADAARLYAGTPRLPERAGASEDAGAAFIGRGDVDAAGRLLQHACHAYEDMGATRDLARAESLLRSVGIRRGRRGRRGRPGTGWASLTATEQAVAELVAQGLSNPQIGERMFVSRRTVQTHLAHVFTKLELSSRTQLAAEVTRRRA